MRQSSRWLILGTLAAVLSSPAWGVTPARPGTVNYVEGQAAIGTETLDAKSIGQSELEKGESLTTARGKVEILLVPGAFLRIGDNSSVTMISSGLTDTEVRVDRGRATLEVGDLRKGNNLRITQNGAVIRITKDGFYDFDPDRGRVRVFEGKALVTASDRQVEVKGGRELDVNTGGQVKAEKFDKDTYKKSDDLYRWSDLRSSYLAEANVSAAQTYVVSGYGWYGGGWYWNPWYGAYTFIPADGFFYSPFGWGFYSPRFVYRYPVFVGRPYYHRFGYNWHPGVNPAPPRSNVVRPPSVRQGSTLRPPVSRPGATLRPPTSRPGGAWHAPAGRPFMRATPGHRRP